MNLRADLGRSGKQAERGLGFVYIGTGLWPVDLMWAVVLDTALTWTWLK
jgi:hypothetical protein